MAGRSSGDGQRDLRATPSPLHAIQLRAFDMARVDFGTMPPSAARALATTADDLALAHSTHLTPKLVTMRRDRFTEQSRVDFTELRHVLRLAGSAWRCRAMRQGSPRPVFMQWTSAGCAEAARV